LHLNLCSGMISIPLKGKREMFVLDVNEMYSCNTKPRRVQETCEYDRVDIGPTGERVVAQRQRKREQSQNL